MLFYRLKHYRSKNTGKRTQMGALEIKIQMEALLLQYHCLLQCSAAALDFSAAVPIAESERRSIESQRRGAEFWALLKGIFVLFLQPYLYKHPLFSQRERRSKGAVESTKINTSFGSWKQESTTRGKNQGEEEEFLHFGGRTSPLHQGKFLLLFKFVFVVDSNMYNDVVRCSKLIFSIMN